MDPAFVTAELLTRPHAATLVVTYPTSRGLRVILTRRPTTLRRHPGQISFPGGMIEESDRTPLAAAVREAREEIGLRLPNESTGQALTPVTVRSTGVLVQPYWVEVAVSPRLKPAAEEVEAILRVPLAELRAPGVFRPIAHPRREGEQTMAYVWRDQTIWGATAQTVTELLRMTSLL